MKCFCHFETNNIYEFQNHYILECHINALKLCIEQCMICLEEQLDYSFIECRQCIQKICKECQDKIEYINTVRCPFCRFHNAFF